MKNHEKILYACMLLPVFVITGCVIRTYPVIKDRVDQDLAVGNQGYLQGQPKGLDQTGERKTTRRTQTVEIELHPLIQIEKKTVAPVSTQSTEQAAPAGAPAEGFASSGSMTSTNANAAMENYTVQKEDTLQKISQKLYGTTRKWMKIYDANRDVLKAPNKIYPGQVIHVPVEGMKTPQENLK